MRPSKRFVLSAAWAAVSLTGCSLAPAYAPPTTAIPTAFKETGPWTPSEPADHAPRGTWWQVYGDTDLDRLEGQVEGANQTLAAAVASYDQARGYARQARSDLFPTLGSGAMVERQRRSENQPLRSPGGVNQYDTKTLSASIDYEVDLWGRVRNQAAAGRANAEAAAADLQSVRLSLQAELADDYVNLRALDRQTALYNDTIAAYTRALELTEARHDGGAASLIDVERARTQLQSAKADMADQLASRALYEHAIASLVGKPASDFSIPVAPVAIAVPKTPVSAPSTLLQRRPDIAAAERRAAAANAGIGVARAAFFPTLSLDATGGFQNDGGFNLLTAPNNIWAIGPALAFTVFDGGRRKAGVDIARAKFDEAAANYRDTVLRAFQQVEDQLALSNQLAVAASEQAVAVEAAKRTENLALVRYRQGAVAYLEVVTAQAAALDAERSAISLDNRRLQASINLIRAVGGGWTAGPPSQSADLTTRASDNTRVATAAPTPPLRSSARGE